MLHIQENTQLILETSLYQTVAKFILAEIPFSIVIDNHNNWNEEFPDRLKKQKQIIFNIKEQALEDSYVKDGKIVIIISIDGIEYMKELEKCDIQAIMSDEKLPPFIVKMFITYPEVTIKKRRNFSVPDEKDLVTSNNMWKKYNPELFEGDS